MAQFTAKPAYDHYLVERVVTFLQTKDARIFPFTVNMSPEQLRAFLRDLRDALADLQDSGSARKTSASGFIMKDAHLKEVLQDWSAANGGWPASYEVMPAPAAARLGRRR